MEKITLKRHPRLLLLLLADSSMLCMARNDSRDWKTRTTPCAPPRRSSCVTYAARCLATTATGAVRAVSWRLAELAAPAVLAGLAELKKLTEQQPQQRAMYIRESWQDSSSSLSTLSPLFAFAHLISISSRKRKLFGRRSNHANAPCAPRRIGRHRRYARRYCHKRPRGLSSI